MEEHLRQIHEEALSKFQRIEPNTAVPPQQRWETPVSARPVPRAVLRRPPLPRGEGAPALGSPRLAQRSPSPEAVICLKRKLISEKHLLAHFVGLSYFPQRPPPSPLATVSLSSLPSSLVLFIRLCPCSRFHMLARPRSSRHCLTYFPGTINLQIHPCCRKWHGFSPFCGRVITVHRLEVPQPLCPAVH